MYQRLLINSNVLKKSFATFLMFLSALNGNGVKSKNTDCKNIRIYSANTVTDTIEEELLEANELKESEFNSALKCKSCNGLYFYEQNAKSPKNKYKDDDNNSICTLYLYFENYRNSYNYQIAEVTQSPFSYNHVKGEDSASVTIESSLTESHSEAFSYNIGLKIEFSVLGQKIDLGAAFSYAFSESFSSEVALGCATNLPKEWENGIYNLYEEKFCSDVLVKAYFNTKGGTFYKYYKVKKVPYALRYVFSKTLPKANYRPCCA